MEQQIRNVISDAYYEARNAGTTMDAAADTAARAVMQLVQPYIEALEELAPIEAEALDAKRLGALVGQTTLDA